MPVSAFSFEEPVITGPAGTLEAKLELPEGGPKATALICHPHPLHGGTMDNKVVYMLARSFLALGAAVLRFNFRGVGASGGSYADGIGEVEDALAASAWLLERWPDLPQYLGGFSFGAAIVVRAADRVGPAGIVTVALPVERIESQATLPEAPWLLVHGEDDELVALDAVIGWLNDQAPGPELEVISGADHFFHGKLTQLKDGVTSFFATPAAADD